VSYALHPLAFAKEPLVAQMAAQGFDGLLFTSPEAVYYLTGLPTLAGSGNPILHALKNQLPFFVYVGADGKLTLFCWIGATLGFAFDVDEVRSFFDANSAIEELRDFLQERLRPESRVGIETSCPFTVVNTLYSIAATPAQAVADTWLLQQRLCKSEAEVALMRRATAIIEATVAELSGQLTVGASRLAVISAAKQRMLAHGATGIGHTTIAFGTSNPEIAFDETLQPQQLVTLDIGAVVDGYCSDNRRLCYTGAVPDDLRALHETMCGIVATVGTALQPGVAFADLVALATQQYEEKGLPPFFLNVGHSIGLQTEELWIAAESDATVQPGMVLNIELYAPYTDGSNIGDEETFLVTTSGPVRLTQSAPAIKSI
jgi:Xaa-Pro aminopeptidase